MSSIESGPKGLQPVRAIGLSEAKRPHSAPVGSDRAAEVANARSAVVRSRELEAGNPPVDADRIQAIRKAVEDGTYPIVPARIADAMIAAGYLLRSGK